MLVLSGKPGEEIVIGENIRLTVLAVRGSQVRLGLTAPAGVLISREEPAPTPGDAGPRPGGPATYGEGATNDQPLETSAAPLEAAQVERLEAHIRSRLNGRVRDFRLSVHGRGLFLEGHARTYYAKQLAQHAVMEATALPILGNEIRVC